MIRRLRTSQTQTISSGNRFDDSILLQNIIDEHQRQEVHFILI